MKPWQEKLLVQQKHQRDRNQIETKSRRNRNYSDIATGIGFFDHMLDGFTRHGLFDLAYGCTVIFRSTDHHTIEDTGIVLGSAIRETIGRQKRHPHATAAVYFPWMKHLVLCAIDLSGRPLFFMGCRIHHQKKSGTCPPKW